jgi:hypothetical protein
MALLKRGNKFTAALMSLLVVVLLVAAFLPILPDPACGRISYATLLKKEWNKRHHKNAGSPAPTVDCKK